MSERTEHGFRTGAIEVTALAEWAKGAAVSVRSGRTQFDVQASPKGQSTIIVMPDDGGVLRVLAPNGAEVQVRWSQRYGGMVVAYQSVRGGYLHSFDLGREE